jgi:hypothetical protein
MGRFSNGGNWNMDALHGLQETKQEIKIGNQKQSRAGTAMVCVLWLKLYLSLGVVGWDPHSLSRYHGFVPIERRSKIWKNGYNSIS